ncbi:MAG: MBL fold metallo-hydrolase [Xanthobacteraceae bacterium]|nr:MBL fold metallo-hydrolase [Xanthobacteraceae bacterium]
MTSHRHWTFGDTSLQRVIESEGPLLSPFEIFPDCTQAHLDANRNWLVPRFQDAASGLLTITIQSFLIRRDGLTVLVDSCSGNDKETRARPQFRRAQWPWLERLREAGVSPEDIDIVLCSHLHVDHVGWNTRLDNGRWVPTFPNARYLISRREWEHWQAAGAKALERTGDYITDSVLPVFAAGQAELVGDEHAVAPNVSVELAPGHTPGQMMVRLGEGGAQAILCADLMHHPLQVRYPAWSTRFCTDPGAARTTRIGFFKAHADTGRLIFPAHFPTPTGGTIARDGKDFRFTFCGEDHACCGG